MKQIFASSVTTLELGRSGERLARQVVFDISAWQEQYGAGRAVLVNQRHGEKEPYSAAIEQEDGKVLWTLTEIETDIPGQGSCELQYYAGDALVKSQTWRTNVGAALASPSAEAPDPLITWFERVLQAEVNAANSADAAAEAGKHYPKIINGTWWLWDVEAGAYKDSGYEAQMYADWNENDPLAPGYIRNRPFYESEYASWRTGFESTDNSAEGELDVEAGKVYRVSAWKNGEQLGRYALIRAEVQQVYEDADPRPAIGNYDVYGFMAYNKSVANDGRRNVQILWDDDGKHKLADVLGFDYLDWKPNGTVALRIEAGEANIVKIPEQFLPDGLGLDAADANIDNVPTADGLGGWAWMPQKGGSSGGGLGAYQFEVREDGNLWLTYEGDTPPDYYINSDGDLILRTDNGSINVGRVRGQDGAPGEPGKDGAQIDDASTASDKAWSAAKIITAISDAVGALDTIIGTGVIV